MKKFYTCLRLVAAAALLSLAPATYHLAPAVAQSQPGLVIGVVDFDLILKELKAGRSVKSQYDKKRSSFDADLEQKRKGFQDQAQKLRAQKSTMSDDEFNKKVGELNTQGKATEKSIAKTKQALDTNLNKAFGQIRSALVEIVTDIAKKRGLTLVLSKSQVMLSADAYDFTDESMKALDSKLPSVKLSGAN